MLAWVLVGGCWWLGGQVGCLERVGVSGERAAGVSETVAVLVGVLVVGGE